MVTVVVSLLVPSSPFFGTFTSSVVVVALSTGVVTPLNLTVSLAGVGSNPVPLTVTAVPTELGRFRLKQGDLDDPAVLQPIYLRRPPITERKRI